MVSSSLRSTEPTWVSRSSTAMNTASPVPQGSPICRITDTVEVAGELGVDLATIAGTGPGGPGHRGRRPDRSQGEAPPSPLRAVISRNMRRSHAETAPVTLHLTVDLGVEQPTQITATVVRAVADVLSRHPHLNGHRENDHFVPAETAHSGGHPDR